MVELDDEDLTQLKGIGPKAAEKLRSKDIFRQSQVALLSPTFLAEVLGVTRVKARDIINEAKNRLLEVALQSKTAKEVKEYMDKVVKRIPTGSIALDKILGGGVPTSAITMFFGTFASGKTQICHQLVVSCKKYLGRAVAWISTEAMTFIPDRILQIAEAQGVEIDLEKDIPIVLTPDIVYNTQRQKLAYELIQKRIEKGLDIGLIVIDSFNARFRSEYVGREVLTPRSGEMSAHLGQLQFLASKYNLAVVLTGQVMGIPDASGQLDAKKRYAIDHALVGGTVLQHSCTFLVALDRVSAADKTWKAITVDIPGPRDEAMFRIDELGVRDISKRGKI